MLKRSTSSRIQRSRGVRVKHILQIAVLLGICFWLIYQVKYSHDKRRELSGKDAKASTTEQVGSDSLKLGRKDLNPRLEEVREKDGKGVQEEEEEDDKHDEGEEEREEDVNTSKTEVDPSEETKKHEVEEEQEGEEKDHEVEEEEEAKGDELEDQDRLVGEVDREEDFLDEEKEREEEPSEDKGTAEGSEDEEKEREEEPSEDKETAEGTEDEDEVEKHGLVEEENQNFDEDEERDEIDSSTHEAREENYKGDDASSAVTHDNNQNGSGMKKLDTNFARKSMIATNTSNQFNDEDKNASSSNGKVLEMAEKGLILKETGGAENKDGVDSAKVLEDSPRQSLSVSTENNAANVTTPEMNTEEDSSSSPPNGTDIVVVHSPQVQNSTADGVDNSNTTADGEEAVPVLATTSAGSMESSNSTGTDLKPDHKFSSDEEGDGGGNIRLVSTMNNTQNQESEESRNESGEVKTG